MDLQNLVTVEYSVSYNQTKLQNVINQLQSKIAFFNSSIQNIQNKCKQIQQSENNVLSRIQNFQKFAIDHLRHNQTQFLTLKIGLRNFLGDQWIKQQSKLQIVSKNFDQIFQSKLQGFNSEAKQISHKVSQLKVQLTSKTSQHEEQTEEVKKTILQQKRQMKKIRQSIRQGINEQFSHYKKQFEEKNLKEIYKKVQFASEASLKSFQETDKKDAQAIEKAIKQYKRVSITNNMHSSTDLPIGKPETLNHLESCGKLLMEGHDENGLQDVFDFQSDIRNRKKPFWGQENQLGEFQNNDIHQTTNYPGFGFLKNLQPLNSGQNQKQPSNGSANQNLIEAKSMEHAINQLKEQLIKIIKSELTEFKGVIETLTANSEKFDTSINNLSKQSSDMKQDFTQNSSKIFDIRNQIENLKHSLYENNEKQSQSSGRVKEVESKLDQLRIQIKSFQKDVQAKSIQQQEGYQSSRFRDIKNVSRVESNSTFKTSMYKNSASSPNFNNQNVIISRLNLLSEKMAKVQEKIKNGSFNSDKNLPRIASSTNITVKNNNNTPSFDLLKKDLQESNQELNKTNERLANLKKHLKELQAAHNLIPKRISKLQTQVTQINQIQQDRLLELIKQLINRVLTDPFNNHFTNTLKRQIHVKFLQIKHEYSSIWKDIEAKVTDRAETAELQKLKEHVETQNIEIKTLINKKADNDDFKKGIKYIDTKLKQVFTYLKGKQDLDNSPQGRKYYMGKKA